MASGPSAKALLEQAALGKSLSEMVHHFGIQERQILRRAKHLGITEELSATRKKAQKEQEVQTAASKYKEASNLNDYYETNGIKRTRMKYYAELLHQAVTAELISRPLCENCQKEHDFSYAAGRFCSSKCSRGFSTKGMSAEARAKQAAGLRQAAENRKKPKSVTNPRKKKNKTTDKAQQQKKKTSASGVSPETRAKLSEQVQKRIREGTHVGWTSRTKKSYAEDYWTKVLESKTVNFKAEKVVNKRMELGVLDNSNYFLDFYVESKTGAKIDIEIDGKQHTYPGRKDSDKIRDDLLNNAGYFIYRIPWVNPAVNQEVVTQQIDKLMKFLQEMDTTAPKPNKVQPITTPEELLYFADQGFTNQEIRDKIVIAESTLIKLLEQHGIYDLFTTRRKEGKKRKIRNSVVSQYTAETDIKELSQKLGYSPVRTRDILRTAVKLNELDTPECPSCKSKNNFVYGYYRLCNPNCQKVFLKC